MGGICSKRKTRSEASETNKKTKPLEDQAHPGPTNESGCITYGYPEPETEPLQMTSAEVTSEMQPEFYHSEVPGCTKQSTIESSTEEYSMLAI